MFFVISDNVSCIFLWVFVHTWKTLYFHRKSHNNFLLILSDPQSFTFVSLTCALAFFPTVYFHCSNQTEKSNGHLLFGGLLLVRLN